MLMRILMTAIAVLLDALYSTVLIACWYRS